MKIVLLIQKKSKIRGEISEGMICSEKELGISDDHEGIMVLPEKYKLGESLEKYFSEILEALFIIFTTLRDRADESSQLLR